MNCNQGTDSMMLLKHIVLNDCKSTNYTINRGLKSNDISKRLVELKKFKIKFDFKSCADLKNKADFFLLFCMSLSLKIKKNDRHNLI